jgi:DNA-binding CsgD family transcriptional regulator
MLGRSSACAIRLSHPSVSRVHAAIWSCEDEAQVRDLGSRNGTFIDGTRVHEGTLTLGRTLRLGAVVLELRGNFDSFALDKLTGLTEGELTVSETEEETDVSKACALHGLSPAQRQVFALLIHGLSEKEAAARLRLSYHTVHAHAKNIYRAVGVHSRPELLARYWSNSQSRLP